MQTIPARMLNEFAYCPRLAYLEWVQGEWADNVETLEGSHTHGVAYLPRRLRRGPIEASPRAPAAPQTTRKRRDACEVEMDEGRTSR
jgi:CRISPR-associated protein Cas1